MYLRNMYAMYLRGACCSRWLCISPFTSACCIRYANSISAFTLPQPIRVPNSFRNSTPLLYRECVLFSENSFEPQCMAVHFRSLVRGNTLIQRVPFFTCKWTPPEHLSECEIVLTAYPFLLRNRIARPITRVQIARGRLLTPFSCTIRFR